MSNFIYVMHKDGRERIINTDQIRHVQYTAKDGEEKTLNLYLGDVNCKIVPIYGDVAEWVWNHLKSLVVVEFK